MLNLFIVLYAGAIMSLAPPVAPDPCLNAVNIGDFRRSRAYQPTEVDPLLCDDNLNESVWYRFDVYTGGKMPESPVTFLHCGTLMPVWLKGQHPTATNPGPKVVEVCASYSSTDSTCLWNADITVRQCQENTSANREYFVYQLKRTPFCSMAYCAGDGIACQRNCSWNGIRKSCSCPAYPAMTGNPSLNDPKIVTGTTTVLNPYDGKRFHPTKFLVDCLIGYPKQSADDGARFDVIFEADGHFVSRLIVNSTNPVASLDELQLTGFLGRELKCKVSSYWDSSDVGSRYLVSNGPWFGMSPVDKHGSIIRGNLVVKEGSTESLWMQPSFPVTTRPCFDSPQGSPCFFTSHRFSVRAMENFTRLSDCQLIITTNHTRSKEIEILPIPSIGNLRKPFSWHLDFNEFVTPVIPPNLGQVASIFQGHRIQSLIVQIVDPDPAPQCQSTGDPHISAFPNAAGVRAYYHIYSIGDFYLVRLQRPDSRLLEIQVRQVPCSASAQVSCNCGVMAREGNSIIGINACKGGTPILVEYILDKDSTSGTIETTPTGWKISLLSGIEINVNSWGNRFMDIFVKGVKAELNKYDGLCSITSLNNAICTTACEHHRVPETKSFFSITSSNLPTCVQPYSVPACRCTGGDRRIEESVRVACATPPTGDFLIKLDMSTVCNTRRRRSVAGVDQNSYEDLISIDDFNNVFLAPIPIYPATTTRRPSTTRFTQPGRHLYIAHRGISGNSRSILNSRSVARVASVDIVSMTIDAEQATTRCRESLRSSTIYSLCNSRVDTTIIISTCALDVQSLNDYSPTQSVPSQFARACLDSIVLALESPQSRDNVMYQNLKNLLSQVERLVCPSQCNGRGQCVNGKCVCNSDFMGSDCSLRRGQIPTVSTIISPVCDIFMHPCKSILVLATNVASSESVTCKMRSINGSIGNVPSVQYSTPSISGGVVVCSLPSLPIDRNNAGGPRETVFVVSVSISNDGQTYSEERLFTVYDSRYMTSNCWRQASKCAIRGRCFAAGDRCVTDNSKLCNPSKCPTKWTAESSSGCSDGFEDCI